MILTSYSKNHNKLRMLFLLFDFDNTIVGLGREEFNLMSIIVLEAWGRLTEAPLPSRTDIQSASKHLFAMRDGVVLISEFAQWVEINK